MDLTWKFNWPLRNELQETSSLEMLVGRKSGSGAQSSRSRREFSVAARNRRKKIVGLLGGPDKIR